MQLMRCSVIALLIVLNPSGVCRAGEDEIDRFRKEYPSAAKRWAAYYASLQGSCVISKGGNAKSRVAQAVFSAGHGSYKVEMASGLPGKLPDPNPEVIFVLGPDREFVLGRRGDQKEFEIEDIRWSVGAFPDYIRSFGRLLMSAHAIQGTPIIKYMDRTGFQVVFAELHPDTTDWMIVKFQFLKGEHVFQAEIVFDTAEQWAIRHAELRQVIEDPASLIVDVRYEGSSAGLPTPKLVRMKDFTGEVYSCTVLEARQEPIPKEAFSLRHYGLPEIAPPEPRRSTSAYIVWGGLAIGGLSVAWLLRTLARRL